MRRIPIIEPKHRILNPKFIDRTNANCAKGMKYALIDGNKAEAVRGALGICANCKSDVFGKCGDRRMHHWARKGERNCDPWWENETEWHRGWKNNYIASWQEIPLHDNENSETHIADVRAADGLVIEFQHSHINSVERTTREKFYKNMVWVIDGTRLKRDYPRFLKARKDFRVTNNPAIFYVDFLDECFPSTWTVSTVPVIFDFRGTGSIDHDPKDHRHHLYCLLPNRIGRYALLVTLSRQGFIDSTISGNWTSVFMNNFSSLVQQQQPAPQKRQSFAAKRQFPYIFN